MTSSHHSRPIPAALERRTELTLSVTERRIYLDINGTSLSSAILERPAQ